MLNRFAGRTKITAQNIQHTHTHLENKRHIQSHTVYKASGADAVAPPPPSSSHQIHLEASV